MAKIITVTANTAIDFFIEIDGLATKDNLLAKSCFNFACGKGINVARAIASLEIPVTCLGFVGLQSLEAFNAIDSEWLHHDFTVVEGKTRTNITLFDRMDGKETHIRTPGFTVTEDDCQRLIDKIVATAVAGDIIILSGSLPPGVPDNFYRTLIERCHSQSVMTFLDSSGAGLYQGLKAKPYLIKPNQLELEEITGQELDDEKAIVAVAQGIIEQGIAWVYVSRGLQGVIVVGEQIALAARVNKLPGKALSHIGCGDAMLAGLAVAILRGGGLQEVVKSGVACGTANLYAIEPGRFDKRLLAEILKNIEIRII